MSDGPMTCDRALIVSQAAAAAAAVTSVDDDAIEFMTSAVSSRERRQTSQVTTDRPAMSPDVAQRILNKRSK